MKLSIFYHTLPYWALLDIKVPNAWISDIRHETRLYRRTLLFFNHSVNEVYIVFCVHDSVHYFTVSHGGLQFLINTLPEDVPSTSPAWPVEIYCLLNRTITVNNIRPISTCLKILSGSSFLSVSPWIKVHIERILVQQFQKLYSLWKKLISCQIPSILKITNRKSAESNLHTDMNWIYTISDSFIPYKYPDRNLNAHKTSCKVKKNLLQKVISLHFCIYICQK